MKLKVGLICFGNEVFRHDIPKEYLSKTIERLENQKIDLIAMSNVVFGDEDTDGSIKTLKSSGIDMLIIQLGTFSMGNNLVKIIKEFEHIPFFVWGFKDPIVKDFPTVPMNSLTSFNMFTSYLYKFEKKFDYAYYAFDDERAWDKLYTTMKSLVIKKQLKYAKYAIVGSRVPGFYLSMVDELRFRNEIGPEIEYYSIATWINQAEAIEQSRVNAVKKEMYDEAEINVNDEVVEKNIKLELALLDYIEENNITAVTIKCWPELQSLYGCSACGILSRLNDKGIVASCEGDLAGLATMDIINKLADKTVFFADPIAVSQEGALKAWHCGFGPTDLAEDKSEVEYTHQATMRGDIGIGIQYAMKKGKVTICKLSEGKKGYRFFAASGTSIAPDRDLLGVQTDIVLDAGFDKVLDVIVENGIEHHYAIVHGEELEKIESLCKWLDMEPIIVR